MDNIKQGPCEGDRNGQSVNTRPMIPLGMDEHCGYVTTGHLNDDEMIEAAKAEDDYMLGPEEALQANYDYQVMRGFGLWEPLDKDAPDSDQKLLWSTEPVEGYEPMTRAAL